MPVRDRAANVAYCLRVPSAPHDLRVSLTEGERRILMAIAECGQTKTVADRLGLSEHTIKNRLNTIYKKLQVVSRTGAILRAVQLGLIDL